MEQIIRQASQVLFKNEKLAINLNYRSFSIAVCFSLYGWAYTKLQVKLQKLNPHETFL